MSLGAMNVLRIPRSPSRRRAGSDPGTAQAPFVTRKAIETHLASVLAKLDLWTRPTGD